MVNATPDSEAKPPSWLSKSFFSRALRSYERDQTIEVQSLDITAPDETKSRELFKVDVIYSSMKYRYNNKNIKLIVKTYPSNARKENLEDSVKKSQCFKNEIQMYTKILPKMESILDESEGATEISKIQLAPSLVYQSLHSEPWPVIVLEDVSLDGFKRFDHSGIANLNVLTVIVKKLGKFHAASMCLQEKGEKLDKFDKHDGLAINKDKIEEMMFKSYQLLNVELPDSDPILSQKLKEKHEENFLKIKSFLLSEPKFKVLCHGDFSSNNILFRNDCLSDDDLLLVRI